MRYLLAVAVVAMPIAAQGPSAPASATRQVSLTFAANVGGTPFQCGTWYALGRTAAKSTASDLRFYIHGITLKRADGTAVPMTLDQGTPWQDEGIALLDFEDGTGPCSNGTPELRQTVTGSVPAGNYTGVEFTVGVPAERNHLELSTQRAPLTLSRLFWSWTGGYKFMRIDLRSERPDTAAVTPWMIHLGSTGCTKVDADNADAACTTGNRPQIALTAFDPDKNTIVFDLAALLAGADVLGNQPSTALGCMAGADDSDCAPVFSALGMPHPTTHAAPIQRAFRVEARRP